MDRRQFVTRAALGAAGAWAAPVITVTPWATAHAAGSPCPGADGRSYDFLVLYSGPVNDNTGPVKEHPADPGSAVAVHEPLPNDGLVTAATMTATGSPTTTPQGYATSAEVQSLQMTTGQFLPLPLTGSATLLRTTASCLCGGATAPTRTATIADLALNVLGVTVTSPDPGVAPNTHAPGFPQTITVPTALGVTQVLADVVFNRQLTTGDGYAAVSALFITLTATAVGAVTQAASFEFARSEVRCLAS